MEKVVLENDDISIEILPSCGGKIWSLISRASGRQWLWHNPFLGLREPQYGDSYIATLDNGGWDEIFPSVAPCKVHLGGSEWTVPDHGDIVALPATIRRSDSHTLVTTTRGRCADFEFEREIRIDGNRVELHYTTMNTGSNPFPFLWCAHPLFRFEPGMEIDLEGTVPFKVESAFGRIPFRAGDSLWWSGFKGSNTIPNPADRNFAPFAMKLFSVADYVKNIAIVSPDGRERLTFFRMNPILRHIGIWMNFGGWSGAGNEHSSLYSLGIEPATAPFDDLGQAIAKNRAIFLKPGERGKWSMAIAVSPSCQVKRPESGRSRKYLLKQEKPNKSEGTATRI